MDAQITITPIVGVITVAAGSTVLGTTRKALELKEGDHDPVIYVPRDAIDMARLVKTSLSTKCAIKGQASYFSIKGKFGMLANAVWSYETPLPAAEAIAGHLAFYPDRVTISRS